MILGVFAAPVSAQDSDSTIIRIESNVVLAPTLVMKKSGEIVHGLKHDDFIVRVDGKDQPFHLDESPDTEKISIVVAVQVGGSAKILFENKRKESWESGSILDGLGTMVENFVGAMDAEIAVVTFDSRVSLVQDFTRDLPTVKEKLNGFEGSDNPGVAILDAVDFAFKLFEKTQPGGRNILFLISESRDDHINGKVKIEALSRKLMASNVQVHSIVFQPLRLKVISDLKSNKPAQKDEIKFETTPGRLSAAIRKILSKNTAHTFTEDTGGEHILFFGKNSFDAAFISQLPANEVIGQAFRTETKMYPEIAIRELAANALVHQNVEDFGSFVMIEIYCDRI